MTDGRIEVHKQSGRRQIPRGGIDQVHSQADPIGLKGCGGLQVSEKFQGRDRATILQRPGKGFKAIETVKVGF